MHIFIQKPNKLFLTVTTIIMPSSSEKIPLPMWKVSFLIASQSFLFGYCFACLNTCLITGDNHSGADCFDGSDTTCPPGTIYNDINLSTVEAQVATSLTILGAWIGCMIGNKPSDVKGRRWTLLWNNSWFIVGGIMCSFSNIYTLFLGRFILGIGVGIAGIVPPVLLSEIATTENRGIITTVHQLALTFGIFMVSMIGYGLVTFVSHGWQYVQALIVVPSLIMLFNFRAIPESPKWILSNYQKTALSTPSPSFSSTDQAVSLQSNPLNRSTTDNNSVRSNSSSGSSKITFPPEVYQSVYDILTKLRPIGYNVDQEIKTILVDVKKDAELSSDEVSWSEVFSWQSAMIIGCGLMLFQSLTGINTVVFYSTTIFKLAGFSESIIGTALFGSVNFLMTVVAAYLIDKFGRKILILGGTYVMFCALSVISIILLLPIDQSIQGMIAVVGVLIFVAGYAIGFGAVCWTIMAEILPTRLRMKAMSLFLSINSASNLVIGLLTLTAIDGLGGVKSDMDDDESSNAQKRGVGALYLIFAAITAASIIFLHIFVPETKDRMPEKIVRPVLQPLLYSAVLAAAEEEDEDVPFIRSI